MRTDDDMAGSTGRPDSADAVEQSAPAPTSLPYPLTTPPLMRRHSRWRWLAIAFSIGIFGLSIAVMARTLAGVSYFALSQAIRATSAEQIVLAALFATLSYFALTGYDALALRQLRIKVPYRTLALGSYASYAISFTLGFPLITGGTVRYWIYSRAGLSAAKVASLTLVAGVTFWLGMVLILGVALTFEPLAISNINHFAASANFAIGLATLAGVGVYFIWVSVAPRHLSFQGFRLDLPGFWLSLGQMALGVMDLGCAAAVLYFLLPADHGMDFLTFVALYVFACLLGIASNAPGGIGVFEATMLKAVTSPSTETLLASLLLFRIIYYLGPFILALALLGANESVRRWNGLREAMVRDMDED